MVSNPSATEAGTTSLHRRFMAQKLFQFESLDNSSNLQISPMEILSGWLRTRGSGLEQRLLTVRLWRSIINHTTSMSKQNTSSLNNIRMSL